MKSESTQNSVMSVSCVENFNCKTNGFEKFVEYRAFDLDSKETHIRLPVGRLIEDKFYIRRSPEGIKSITLILNFSIPDDQFVKSEFKKSKLDDEISAPSSSHNDDSTSGKLKVNKNPDRKVIELKVFGKNCEEIYFKVKMMTKLGKLKQAYCKENDLRFTSVMFLYENQRIDDGDTAKKLGMVNGDQIIVAPELFD